VKNFNFYQEVENSLQKMAVKIIWLFIIIYIFTFCLISYFKFISFSYHDIDLSVIELIFWNTIHGNFVTENIGEATIFSGGHLFLIIFLLAPLYAIYPHPLTLLFLQTIALAIPAYFIFRFARDKIDTTFAIYFALAYLLYPALAFINLFEFHLIAFAPLFLLPMFIFFDQRKFWPFVLFMFFSLACKENVSLVIFGLGVYALFRYVYLKAPFIKKEDWKWIVIPLLSGAFWFIAVTQFIQPTFTLAELKQISDSRGMMMFYGWLGRTPAEIIKNIFLHPGQVLRGIFIPAKNRYLLHLFGPLAFLSILGLKEMALVLFALLEGLLSQRGAHFSIYYQYPALVLPFIFISAVFGLRRLLQFRFFQRLRLYILFILLSISLFFAFKIGPLFHLPFNQWSRNARDILKEEFARLVPSQASVTTSFELATRITHRDKLFFMYHINIADWSSKYAYLSEKYAEKADYLLVDFQDYLTYFGFYHQDSDLYLKNFLKKYNWNVAYEINNISLWTRAKTDTPELIETIDNFPAQLSSLTFGNEYIKFVGSHLKKKVVLGHSVLYFEGYLECLKQTDRRYMLQLDFRSKDTKQFLYRHYFVASDRIYPTKRWKKGEKIRISQNILIPDSVKIEQCDLILNFHLVQ
jgi:uncharacterized membrane protein